MFPILSASQNLAAEPAGARAAGADAGGGDGGPGPALRHRHRRAAQRHLRQQRGADTVYCGAYLSTFRGTTSAV